MEVSVEQDAGPQGTSQIVITIMKTIHSGLNPAVETPGKSAAGLTKLALVFALAVSPLLLARPTAAVDTLPILWEAGGQNSGNDGAGQAARVAVDLTGNVAVVSGPSLARDLAVTSYTSTGVFRWQNAVSPSIGTFQGDWVAAAANGDFVAVGHNVNSRGNPIAITLVRFGSEGTLQWRWICPAPFPVSAAYS